MHISKKAVLLQRKSQNSVKKMTSRLEVYIKGVYAGELERKGAQSYEFTYDEAYRIDSGLPALCLNMPKSQAVYESERLFTVFANMLTEGYNRRLQSRTMRIDENDDFALLAATAQYDTIGAITVKPIEEVSCIDTLDDSQIEKISTTKKLGQIIKARRKELGLTQNTLALLSQVGINTIVSIERGSKSPSVDTLTKAADVLGLELKLLVKG